MPNVVLDTNQAQSPELAAYLGAARTNLVLLVDFFDLELGAVPTLERLQQKYATLARFPSQVLIFNSMERRECMHPLDLTAMIDERRTQNFPTFIAQLMASTPDTPNGLEMLRRMQASKDELEHFVDSFGTAINATLDETRGAMQPAEVASLRRGEELSRELHVRLAGIAHAGASSMRKELPNAYVPKNQREAIWSIFFRVCAASINSAIIRVREGQSEELDRRKARNDLIDSIFCAHAFGVDDLMTDDRRAARTHAATNEFLRKLLANTP